VLVAVLVAVLLLLLVLLLLESEVLLLLRVELSVAVVVLLSLASIDCVTVLPPRATTESWAWALSEKASVIAVTSKVLFIRIPLWVWLVIGRL
jgi:hypothetical protein